MKVGGLEEVDSSDDVGNSLERVVMNDGKVVTGADVFSYNDSIAEVCGISLLRAL